MDDATLRREIEEAGFDPDEVLKDDMDEDEAIVIFRFGPNPEWEAPEGWDEEEPSSDSDSPS